MKNFYALMLLLLVTIGVANAAPVISTAGGGNWNNGSSWVGGLVPSATDDVQIISGSTITINASVTSANLQIAGILNFSSAALTLTVNGNLTVNSGGILTTSDGAFAKSVIVNGNLLNNC